MPPLAIEIDAQDLPRVTVRLRGELAAETPFRLLATQRDGIGFRLDSAGLVAAGAGFVLHQGAVDCHYHIDINLKAPTGSDPDLYLTYPFADEGAFFLSSGFLPLLSSGDLGVRVRCIVPPGWEMYDNAFLGRNQPAAALQSFFIYAQAAPPIAFEAEILRGDGSPLRYVFVQASNSNLPRPLEAFFLEIRRSLAALDARIAPYTRHDTITVLILQSTAATVAPHLAPLIRTGENLPGGLLILGAPDDRSLFKRLGVGGAGDYAAFLLDGLIHETVHLYLSASELAPLKAMAYCAPDCPPAERHLLGEALTAYIHRWWLYSRVYGDEGAFFRVCVPHWQDSAAQRGHPAWPVRWLRLDHFLRGHGLDVLDVLAGMVDYVGEKRAGIPNLERLIDYLCAAWGLALAGDLWRLLREEGAALPPVADLAFPAPHWA